VAVVTNLTRQETRPAKKTLGKAKYASGRSPGDRVNHPANEKVYGQPHPSGWGLRFPMEFGSPISRPGLA